MHDNNTQKYQVYIKNISFIRPKYSQWIVQQKA